MYDFPIASIRSGMLIGDGAQAALSFDIDGREATVVFSAQEVSALLSVCAGLVGQSQASGSGQFAVVPVEDWQVGVTASNSVLLRLVSHGGAAFAYQLSRREALAIRNAITLAAAAEGRGSESQAQAAAPRAGRSPDLEQLTELRLQCRDNPAALALIDSCGALIAELDAANDEGRELLREAAVAFVQAVRDRLGSAPMAGEPT